MQRGWLVIVALGVGGCSPEAPPAAQWQPAVHTSPPPLPTSLPPLAEPPTERPASAAPPLLNAEEIATPLAQNTLPTAAMTEPSPTAKIPMFDWVSIRAGTFVMGSTPEQIQQAVAVCLDAEPALLADETPAHSVSITQPYLITATEVTQSQYAAVMGDDPSPAVTKRLGPNFPVVGVLHSEAEQFCERLTKATGQTHRLPTEAEWEYACRAGTTTLWSFGDDAEKLTDYAWFDFNADSGQQEVGTLAANPWQLFDMHGNVWEWCSDLYQPIYPAATARVNPTGPAESWANELFPGERLYVVRGGSYANGDAATRSAERDFGKPRRMPNIGFRIVREEIASPEAAAKIEGD